LQLDTALRIIPMLLDFAVKIGMETEPDTIDMVTVSETAAKMTKTLFNNLVLLKGG
jgi:hypothetical protein